MSTSLGQWWVRLARRGSGGGPLRLWPLLVGREVLPVFLGFEVLDQVFLPPASGRSFIEGASAWFFLPLLLTAVSLACGLAFAVLLGGGGFPCWY